jgi:hypothetical protein
MEWDRRRFLSASIITAAYPAAMAVAGKPQRNDLLLNFEDAGGSPFNTGAENNQAYTNAVEYLSRHRGGTLFIPDKVYPFDGLSYCRARNVTVLGYGATFIGDSCRLGIGGSSYNIHGLSIVGTTGKPGAHVFDCEGSDCHFKDIHLEFNPPTATHIGYLRQNTSGNLFENISFSGGDGIIMGGHDHEIRGGWGDNFGGDDCWALNATYQPCYNIRFNGFRGRGFAGLVSIGSAIGTSGVDNPDYDLFVKDVVVENCVAIECTYLAYIKPCAVGGRDYRDGLVENVQVLNCRHEDPAGKRFRNAVYVSTARGAIVRGVTVQNLTVNARGATPLVRAPSALFVHVLKFTNGNGAGGSIDGISVSGLQSTDPHYGAPTSETAPGSPIHSFIGISKSDPAIGNIGRVEVSDAVLDGAARTPVVIGREITGPIALSRCTFKNYAAGIYSSVDKGSVLAYSQVSLRDIVATPSPSAPSDTRGVMPDAHPDKTVEYSGEVATTTHPTIAAGETIAASIHSPPRDSWISKIEIIVGQTVAQSDVDFVRFTFRNGANGQQLAEVTSSSSGLSFPAGTPVSVNGNIQFTGDGASLPKGAQLLLEVTHHGSGAEVVDPVFVVHSVPYGAN